jgi:hypothetical protein
MQGGRLAGSSAHSENDEMANGVPGLQMERRRKIRSGWRLDESFFKIRMPFFDNAFHDFVMAIPPNIRNKGVFYRNALLHNFERYYRMIPWQQAGVPISLPPLLFKAGTFCKRSLSRVKRELRGLGLPVYDSKLYFDVSDMMRGGNNRARIEKILFDKNAIFQEYLPENARTLSANKRTCSGVEKICRIFTFEIWMRQATAPAFRPDQLFVCDDLGAGLT